MKLRSLAIAFVASLLIIGCATKQQQELTPVHNRSYEANLNAQTPARPDAKIGKSF
jgi:uncharacterized protein YcfL